MSLGPSESVVAAADAPIPLLRAHLGTFLRVAGPAVLVSQLAMVPGQLAQGWMMQARGPEVLTRMLALYGLQFGGICALFLLYPVVSLAVYAVAVDVLDGREPSLGRALRAGLHPMRWLTALVVTGVAGMGVFLAGVGMCVAMGFLAFTFPIVLEEGVVGVEAARRSVVVAQFGAHDRWWKAPWSRVALVFVAVWGVSTALSQPASLPTLIDMLWNMWDAFSNGGDPALAFQGASPVAVVSTAILGTVVRVFTEAYACLAVLLVYRDVRRRMTGRHLEDGIAALEGAR